jgi:hypothetical protein
MCNSIFINPLDRFSVGPVVPVVLHRILVRAGGTAGWDRRAQGDADRAERQSPTGPTHRSHQKSAQLPAVPPVPPDSTAVLSRG